MGSKMIDEFYAKQPAPPCREFRDTAEVFARHAARLFFNTTASVRNVTEAPTPAYSLVLDAGHPLQHFVEIPPAMRQPPTQLSYCNVYAGMVAGALKAILFHCDVRVVRDTLWGHDEVEIRVECRGIDRPPADG